MRVKGGVVTQRRHKKILKMVKGQWGTRSKLFRRGNEAMMKSYWYAYRDRRVRRREFRRLWITRINAASRQNGLSYSRLMHGLKTANVGIDRKVLADLAIRDATAFSALTNIAKEALDNGGPSRKVVEMSISRPGSVGHTEIEKKSRSNGKAAPPATVETVEIVEQAEVVPDAPAAQVEEAPAPKAKAEPVEAAPEPVVEPQTPIMVEAAEEMQADAEASSSEAVEAAPAEKQEKAKPRKAKKDDLKKIEGIGPKIASVLKDAGIETFAQLADTTVEELDKIVRQDAGITIAKPDTWPEQAALAAEGRMDDLKALQDTLKGGVRQ